MSDRKSSGEARAPSLSICIVNWETRDLLRRCLLSVRRHPAREARTEVIVVDNGSCDGSAAMVATEFPEAKLITNRENVGFAGANNQAAAAAAGDLLLLLNPDTEVLPGSLDGLVEFMRTHTDAGAAAAQLLNPDGSIQPSCRGFPRPRDVLFDGLAKLKLVPRSARLSRYRMAHFGHDAETRIDFAMAAALCVRRSAWERLGGMDAENFPLYYNDTDLCYRLWEGGWHVYFTPKVQIVHHLGASTRLVPQVKVRDGHEGLIRFYRKHFLRRSPAASQLVIGMTKLHLCWALMVGRLPRPRGDGSSGER